MKISRSGYYKWLKNKDTLNQFEKNRLDLKKLIEDIHRRKPSYGYRRINAKILTETGWKVSDNLVHKVCKLNNIKSKAKHYKYKKPGEESLKYENLLNGNWKTTRPFEKIVSDTTKIWFKKKSYDWTFYLDIFNNEIINIFVIATFAIVITNNVIVVIIKCLIGILYHNFLEIIVLVQKNTKYDNPVAIAAPTAPYIGIKIVFNIKLTINDIIETTTLYPVFLENEIPNVVVSLIV